MPPEYQNPLSAANKQQSSTEKMRSNPIKKYSSSSSIDKISSSHKNLQIKNIQRQDLFTTDASNYIERKEKLPDRINQDSRISRNNHHANAFASPSPRPSFANNSSSALRQRAPITPVQYNQQSAIESRSFGGTYGNFGMMGNYGMMGGYGMGYNMGMSPLLMGPMSFVYNINYFIMMIGQVFHMLGMNSVVLTQMYYNFIDSFKQFETLIRRSEFRRWLQRKSKKSQIFRFLVMLVSMGMTLGLTRLLKTALAHYFLSSSPPAITAGRHESSVTRAGSMGISSGQVSTLVDST